MLCVYRVDSSGNESDLYTQKHARIHSLRIFANDSKKFANSRYILRIPSRNWHVNMATVSERRQHSRIFVVQLILGEDSFRIIKRDIKVSLLCAACRCVS